MLLLEKSTTLDNFGISRLLQTNAFSMVQDLGFSPEGPHTNVDPEGPFSTILP